MKKKVLWGLLTGLLILGVFGVANAALLTFDDLITGQTTYSYDGDGDAIDDVIFTTTDPSILFLK